MGSIKAVATKSEFLEFYTVSELVGENKFRTAAPDTSAPPALADVKHLLPVPRWDANPAAIAAYWKTWELAFKNLRAVAPENGFVAPFIDTAFNNCLFMWDSCFILLFGRYGHRAFPFQRTLDNLYAKQHLDGFISREVTQWSGADRFHRHDPVSTGPNILAWCEWEYYKHSGDKARLAAVFPVLLAYHQWCRSHRTWPDGSYHSSGLSCGMDNCPRTAPGYSACNHHSFMAWIDATAQAALSARLLASMGRELGLADRSDVVACGDEFEALSAYIDGHMWDAEAGIYVDRHLRPVKRVDTAVITTDASAPSSDLSTVHSVASFWPLLAGIVRPTRVHQLVAHLDDPTSFNRSVRVPSLAAKHPDYKAEGGYWEGGVWAPTTYMVLRGLTLAEQDDAAADIGCNYHAAVVKVFESTGTIWENLAPEHATSASTSASTGAGGDGASVAGTAAAGGGSAAGGSGGAAVVAGPVPGSPSKADFVGWSGLGPVAVLFEYVFGIRADVPRGELRLDVRLLDAYGVSSFPFGADGLVCIDVGSRGSAAEEPVVTVVSTVALTVVLTWGGTMTEAGGAATRRTSTRAPFTRQFDVTPSTLPAAPAATGTAASAASA